jgi:hypothetical protein
MSRRAKHWVTAATAVAFAITALASGAAGAGRAKHSPRANAAGAIRGTHVLLISIDGLHQSDLAKWVSENPSSVLAKLSGAGTTFTQASTSRPSDSFPGLLAPLTGGLPRTTGVFYDDSYDRALFSPPAQSPGLMQNCSGTPGTEALYAENLDVGAPTAEPNSAAARTILGVGAGFPGHAAVMIDPKQLPYARRGQRCMPVMPNEFLRTNTIFGVAHQAGLRTAWSDKHPAYQIVNGTGTANAVDDLFTPEINADIIPGSLTDTRGNTIKFPFPNPSGNEAGPIITDYLGNTEAYDQIKVDAILNEIEGHRSSGGTSNVGMPAILGMNFQSVSVGQKAVDPTLSCASDPGPECDPSYVPGGYEQGGLAFTPQMSGNTHYAATPTFPAGADVPGALNYVDAALGEMVDRLAANGQLESTRIIITAKHGQSPINPASLQKIGHAVTSVLGKAGVETAQITDDDVALVWMKNHAQADAAVTALTTSPGKAEANVESVLSGSALASAFGDPLSNSRTPDLIVQPTLGTIYSKSTKKVAEHGGFSEPDTHVALLVADGSRWGASGTPKYDSEPVQTTQIAPTILRTLGLNPERLDAVRAEGTRALPSLGF